MARSKRYGVRRMRQVLQGMEVPPYAGLAPRPRRSFLGSSCFALAGR
jgi:hypothetical protein